MITNSQKNNEFRVQIDIPDNAIQPDVFVSSNSIFPAQNFVISRNKAGEVVSVYGDDVWNLTPYHPRGAHFSFSFSKCIEGIDGVNPVNVDQMKQFIFLLMYKSPSPVSIKTLLHYHHLNFDLIKFAHKNNCLITDLLSQEGLIKSLIRSLAGSKLKHLKSLIIKFIQIGNEDTGFEAIGGTPLKDLTNLYQTYNQKYRQHPPIPTQIYSSLLSNLLQELRDFKTVFPQLSTILKLAVENPLYGKCASSRHRMMVKNKALLKDENLTDFDTVITSYGLQDFITSKGISHSIRGLGRYLTEAQIVCKLIIHAFSGTRDEEAQYLLYDCIVERKLSGRSHTFLEGVTTKLLKGQPKKTVWVTSSEGAEAVVVAKMIADFIYLNCLKDKPGSNSKMNYPLFISTSYLPFMPSNAKSEVDYRVTCIDLWPAKKLSARILPEIKREDILELERIDPHRAWTSEDKFQVGKAWPLTTHQFRRSLALYATSSGLVSLTSLKRQLQHITEEMTLYYARGSAYAKSLAVDELNDFCLDYQATQPESQSLSWIFNVLFSPEKLAGAHGKWVESHMRPKEGFLIEHDRSETIKKFKNGQMAFKETPLGGCATVDPCEKRAMRSIVACLDCKSAVIKPSKLNNVISFQRRLVQSLDKNSIEYRMEMEDLAELEKKKDSF